MHISCISFKSSISSSCSSVFAPVLVHLKYHCSMHIFSHNPPLSPSLHEQVLGHQVADEHLPDINLIGEFGDVTELGKLVQLVLGCAVSCEKKQGELAGIEEAMLGNRKSPMEKMQD